MEQLFTKAALTNALSGALADVFTTLVLYPLDIVKLRTQACRDTTWQDVVKDGVKSPLSLYVGTEVKILQSVQQKFQYFYVYAALRAYYLQSRKRHPSIWIDLLFGYISALEGLLTSLPLEVTSTQMIAAKKSDGFVKTFIRQYREGGILSFYKTSFASAVLCINPAITYMIFEALKLRILRRRNSKSGLLGTLEALFVGILAKSIATLITFPLIRAKVLMSVDKDGKASEGLLAALSVLWREEGFGGFYVGFFPQLMKASCAAALMLSMKERIYNLVRVLIMGRVA